MSPATIADTNAPLAAITAAQQGADEGSGVVDGDVDEISTAVRELRSSADVMAASMVAAWRERMRPAHAGPLHRV